MDDQNKNILIIGANGFIGTHLTEAILTDTDWQVTAFDIDDENVSGYGKSARYAFTKGDIFTADEWLHQAVEAADVVLPLAGIAKPAYYIKKPLWTFELDFEQNLKIVRMCADAKKRIIFPSTSEVYGMATDEELLEYETPLITGPVSMSRWIYSCSKQMMDRVIVAYGSERNLDYTLFRPFNWAGPRLDSFKDAEERTARAITQMIYDVIHRGEISLVGGGASRRSFLWIGDATEALLAIIRNDRNAATKEIFNIGNPENNASVRELAEAVVAIMQEVPSFREAAQKTRLRDVTPEDYYQKGYQDTKNRVPGIRNIREKLGWKPRTALKEIIRKTVAYYASEPVA